MATAILAKILTETDIDIRLSLPSESLKCFPALSGNKQKVDFQVRDECGRVWDFQIYTRTSNKYSKPVISKGWGDFVRSKELTVGDMIAFYMDKEQAAGDIKYSVRVGKAVNKFGAVLLV